MSAWTSSKDLREQVERLWRSGKLLAVLLTDEQLFPRRLVLKTPTARQLSDRFAEVREWVAELEDGARHYRLERETINNRVLGTNTLPSAAWVETREEALAWLGKRRDAQLFAELVALTRQRQPALLVWLERRPLKALELAEEWARLLDIVVWLRRNPRPGVYLRQVDLAGIDTKFIERNRGVLTELLDLALPETAIDDGAVGAAQFERRYGFRAKPGRVRFRLLDLSLTSTVMPSLQRLGDSAGLEVTVTAEAFAALRPSAEHVFITENEVNFLAFPPVPSGIVVFGGGYALELLSGAHWLQGMRVHYWGDIDTHGFAILDRLRAALPGVESLLMDRATLEAHRNQWSSEPQPHTRALMNLDPDEASLYDDLCLGRLGERVRLEQELVGFNVLERALERLA